jgi:spore maturation protein CgeB
MKVLYHIPYPLAVGADRWIYEGWKHAYEDLGHEVYELRITHDIPTRVQEVKPDLFYTAYNFFKLKRDHALLRWIRQQGTKIFMRVDWPRRPDEVEVFRTGQVADVYLGEREPESMAKFEKATGQKYHLVPNAANKLYHFPVSPAAKYRCDIVYLGAYLPQKRKAFKEILLPLTKKYRVGIFGPYWTAKDNVLRFCSKVSKTIGFASGVDYFEGLRVQIPSDEENLLYSSAKICLNFHEREDDGSQPHYIVNQRTFKISACGGFQLCDYVPALRRYFDEDEVVMARDGAEWRYLIDYYLSHDEERKRIQQQGTKRALRDHLSHNRVDQIMDLYKSL